MPTVLSVGPEGRLVRVGLDIGGTKADAVAVDLDGAIVAQTRRPSGKGSAGVLRDVVDSVNALRAELGDGAEVLSVGVGIPGLVDAARGRVLHAVNLDVESLDLADLAGAALNVPVAVENDVKAAALGAAAIRGDRHGAMAYLNLGTGVAAGIVVNGRLWRGARGTAGEVGHISVDREGRPCSCGQHGCIETLCGGGALARAWGRGGDLPVLDILDAADRGDRDAQVLRADLFRGSAAAVRVLVLSADVDTVVIGGGLTALGDRLMGGIRSALTADAAQSPFLRSLDLEDRVQMLPSGSPAAALGAALVGAPIPEEEIAIHG